MHSVNEIRLFLLVTVMHKYAEKLHFSGGIFRNLSNDLEAILRPPQQAFVTTTSLAGPVRALVTRMEQEQRSPRELLIVALMRSFVSLSEKKRPSVDTVMHLLWTSNILLLPEYASVGAMMIWKSVWEKLRGSYDENASHYLRIRIGNEGEVYFSLSEKW